MILAIGNSGIHEVASFDLVVGALMEYGERAVLFKQDKCLEGEFLVARADRKSFAYSVIVDGDEYNIDDFSAIWYLKPNLPRELLNYQPEKYRQFIHSQFFEMRQAIWALFGHKKWIDNPWLIRRAENKIYQLGTAIRSNLIIPSTLITSDPDRVREFYEENNGEIIVKTLASSPIVDYVIYTNKVSKAHIENIDSLKMAPSIFQEIISKDYELRIIIVGDKFFTIKIYSQDDEETILDWRRRPKLNDFEVRMEQTQLPNDIQQNISSFMETMGLRFGCIDMIVTPEGDYVFLEINPNGQWYFAQMKTGAKIADAIAELLI